MARASEPRQLTNADLAREVSSIGIRIAKHSAEFAHGMWNPHFSAASADGYAVEILEDLCRATSDIERRIKAHKAWLSEASRGQTEEG